MATGILPKNAAILYLRMSSAKQDKSIAAQRDELLRLAKSKGYKIIREYLDEAISGDATEKRDGFLRLREDCENGPDFSTILVWNEDRFSRNDPLELGWWIKPIRDSGVVLETPTGRVDWDSLGGRLLYLISQEMRHDYLRQLSRNVARGHLAAAKKGTTGTGGASPFGYKSIDGAVVLDPIQAETVRRIFLEYLKPGSSLRSVVNLLNGERILSSTGGKWQSSTVRDVLTNEKYTGTYVRFKRQEGKYHAIVGGEIAPRRRTDGTKYSDPLLIRDHHEAIVDQRTFDLAQAKLKQRRTRTAKRHGHQYAFTGLVRCGDCGGPMCGAVSRNGSKVYSYVYKCLRFHTHGKHGCHCNSIDERVLIDVVTRKMQSEVFSNEAIKRLLVAYRKRLASRRKAKPADGDDKLRRRIEVLDRQIDQGAERVLTAPEAVVGTIYGKIEKLREERDQLKARLNAPAQAEADASVTDAHRVKVAGRVLRDLRKAFKDADPSEIRDLIGPLVSKIELHYSHVPQGKKERNLCEGGTIFVRPLDPGLAIMFGTSTSSIRLRLF
jgi:DNA invertase Pin-like site-specific DNA recombinase